MSADVTEKQYGDALELLDQRKAQMPTRCPSWCTGEHIAAIEEWCDVESARVHKSADRCPAKGVRVEMWQDHIEGGYAPIEIRIEVHEKDDYVTATMETSEARSLAAMLLHLADAEELHRYDNR